MIWLGLAFVVMFGVVYAHVFLGLGGSSKKKMQNRMDRRAAKIDYIRLARETDEARRRNRSEAQEPGQQPPNTPQAEDDAEKPAG
ncbi:hypothetical protein FF098_017165 [Parvularcula flava]|uniref:Uncharacterized protein n=1 Tax=Aquisalinus luteolus TaxID=1566827 RepID=A0A8J3A4H6_9PROT|nr:hypothetical protein [Aquisalinus luteolus]NHK29639.1 hypothetical protein [Aquisalinus luteolus]GGI02249.1 hypothetical protein GCM10011355_34810 [Aquisalinus luteolus]